MVRSPDGDTMFFEITRVLQGNTIEPFLFIVFLDYILKTAIDKSSELCFTLTQRRSIRYPALYITDIDYADDIAVTANTMKATNILLHQLEETADDIGLEINSDKTEYMRLNPNSDDDGNMKSKNGNIIKQVENFKYLGSFIISTNKDIEIRIAKA